LFRPTLQSASILRRETVAKSVCVWGGGGGACGHRHNSRCGGIVLDSRLALWRRSTAGNAALDGARRLLRDDWEVVCFGTGVTGVKGVRRVPSAAMSFRLSSPSPCASAAAASPATSTGNCTLPGGVADGRDEGDGEGVALAGRAEPPKKARASPCSSCR
jgi:hypothetical protein